MKKTTHRGHGTMTELNITPLLDLVFVLLVIFIITTPQMMNNLEISLPPGKSPPADSNAPKPKLNRLSVEGDGHVVLNDEVVPEGGLLARLKAIKESDPERDPKIVVKGADEVDYQSMVMVLDALRQLEITKIGMVTVERQ